ncbi:hypothetical protein F5Y18DRAFT_422713 [Xylariaceae sp. FL1019]|nr:hypothetical protein F5Y18DRAFT_422713 [Xylariaceae sp. FL1019]
MDQVNSYMQSLREVRRDVEIQHQKLAISFQEATSIADSGKAATLNDLSEIFTGLDHLAKTIAGDFDSQATNAGDKEKAKNILRQLVANANTAVANSDNATSRVRQYYLEDLDIRAKLGILTSKIEDVSNAIETTREKAQIESAVKQQVVNAAEANTRAAEESFEKAEHEYNEAKQTAKKWKDAQNSLPWWATAIPPATFGVLIAKGVMAAGGEITSSMVDGERQNYLNQQSFYLQQRAELEQLQYVIAHTRATLEQAEAMKLMAETISTECFSTIAYCQETELKLSQAKSSLNNILSKCQYVQELIDRSNYTETKQDFLEVILGSLIYGTIDRALVNLATITLNTVQQGDVTHLLATDNLAKQVEVIVTVTAHLNEVKPLSA